MRDELVYAMVQRQANKIYQLYRSMGILECRMKAMEMALAEKWGNGGLTDRINEIHKELLAKVNQDIKEATEKAQTEAKKPRLTIVNPIGGLKPVALILFVLSLSSCVTRTQYTRDRDLAYNSGFQAANLECYDLQVRISDYLNSLKGRLSQFDQLNEDGSLRTKDNDDSEPYDN